MGIAPAASKTIFLCGRDYTSKKGDDAFVGRICVGGDVLKVGRFLKVLYGV